MYQFQSEAERLFRQYRTIPAIDKSKDMLIAKYGEQGFFELRRIVAQIIVARAAGNRNAVNKDIHSSQKKTKGKWLVFGTERIDGTKSNEYIADRLLSIFGEIDIIKKYKPYLSNRLSEKRCSEVMAIADALYERQGDFYLQAVQKKKEIQQIKEDSFAAKVIEQNSRPNNHKPKYTGIGKIILIASGNKR